MVSVEDASATAPGATATGYGYGLYVQEDRVLGRFVSHSGGYPGFGSHMRWHPASGWGVILLGNATYTPAHIAAGAVLTQIVSESTVAASSTPPPPADERGPRPPIPVTPWPQTVSAMSLAEDLLDGRTGGVTAQVWASNMDLDVPRELVLRRSSSRRVCRDCGTNYVASGSEKLPWICEVCGGDVMQRDDDTTEAIAHRLDLYEEQTSPLIEYYQRDGRLAIIDGVASPDEVFRRLTAAVEASRRPG